MRQSIQCQRGVPPVVGMSARNSLATVRSTGTLDIFHSRRKLAFRLFRAANSTGSSSRAGAAAMLAPDADSDTSTADRVSLRPVPAMADQDDASIRRSK